MITKEELDETIGTLTEKFNYIARELESVWQYANDKTLLCKDKEAVGAIRQIANRIEHLQFDEYASPSSFANHYRFHKFYEIIKENESAKNLDKFMELERFVSGVSRMVDNYRENEKKDLEKL